MNRAVPPTTLTERSEDDSVTETVVKAVANAEGVDSTEVTPPLGQVIDPDALERVVATVDGTVSTECVAFTYAEYRVGVSADGDVALWRN